MVDASGRCILPSGIDSHVHARHGDPEKRLSIIPQCISFCWCYKILEQLLKVTNHISHSCVDFTIIDSDRNEYIEMRICIT